MGEKAGSADKACADCHGDATTSMKGVAARYPAFDKALARPVTLDQRINLCRANHQQAPALPYESRDLLALSAFVAHQSRGVAITAGDDPQLKPFVAQGRDLFMQREGQLNLACTNCHDDNFRQASCGLADHARAADRLSALPPGVADAGSIERRLRSCMTGVRAQAYDYGAPELVALELYLMSRARGLPMETPAVRP
ncbi:sulfur oxidation c-type cytochrome SoxA [Bradyrhizobium japonicum]